MFTLRISVSAFLPARITASGNMILHRYVHKRQIVAMEGIVLGPLQTSFLNHLFHNHVQTECRKVSKNQHEINISIYGELELGHDQSK